MIKNVIKILIVLICMSFTVLKGFCADIDLHTSFVSDKANVFGPQLLEQLRDVLKNLHNETGCDVVVITLNSLRSGESFSDVEKQIKKQYILGGKRSDMWVIVILTKEPYRMNIRVGKGLRRVITGSTLRGMQFEFLFSRLNNSNNGNLSVNAAGNDLYNTTMFLAELIADENNVRLHTSAIPSDNEIMGNILYVMGGGGPQYFRPIDPTEKYIRRNNLHMVIFIIIIGIFSFIVRFGRRRRRRRLRFF